MVSIVMRKQVQKHFSPHHDAVDLGSASFEIECHPLEYTLHLALPGSGS